MISKKNINAVVLQLPSKKKYQKNLDTLLELLDKHSDKKLIVAPEVFLTAYDYKHINSAAKFSSKAIEILKKRVGSQIVVFTIIKKKGNSFVNQAVVIHNHKVVYRQNKAKLFRLGEEHKHLESGETKNIKPFTIDGVSYGLLICFELRFKDLWKQLEGVDIILVPSHWGLPRKGHLEILSKALAVMNQSFVLVANSSDADMASSSAIISPNGNTSFNDKSISIEGKIDFKKIKKMRRYIVMD